MMKNKTEYQKSLTPDPSLDGTEHINVHYNHAGTQLGRVASTYYVSQFLHPYFGPFKCIEGFLLFVKTGCRDDSFRNLTGVKAKAYYKRLVENGVVKDRDLQDLERLLISAHYAKFNSNDRLKKLMVESTLPFDQYYLYGVGKVPIRPRDSEELVTSLTTVRQHLKDGTVPEPMSVNEYAQLVRR